jgi:hypothetical protein
VKSELKKGDIGRINKKEIKEEFIKEVAANIQNTRLKDAEDINEIWNKIKEGINEAAGKKSTKRRKTTKK